MVRTASAAVLREVGGRYSIETVELDDLHDDEVLVRIEAVGVCHTDANMQMVATMPAVLGHEGTGVVEEVGRAVGYVKPGDRVIISWPACGVCANCVAGKRYICEVQFPLLFSGRRRDGSPIIKLNGEWISGGWFQQSSFATHAVAPADSLVKVEGDLPPEVLAALPCGVMTGAGAVLNALAMTAQDDLAVFGAGAVGLSAIMAAHIAGVDPIIAVDVNPQRLSLALELGATHALDARTDDVAARIKQIIPRGLGFAIDTSGVTGSWVTIANALRYGGTFGVLAAPAEETLGGDTHSFFSKAVRTQFIMAGSSVPRLFLPQLIKWYEQGRFPVDRLVTTFAFAHINEAFDAAHHGRVIKPVLLMP